MKGNGTLLFTLIAVAVVALGLVLDLWRNRRRQREMESSLPRSAPPGPEPSVHPWVDESIPEPLVTKPAPQANRLGRSGVPVGRWIISLLACVALLTFFFPLLSLRLPVVGGQDVTGYDVVSKMGQFSQRVAAPGSPQRPAPQNARSEDTLRDMPISVRAAGLIAVFIMGAFACALLTLLGAVFGTRLSRVSSTVGVLLGVGAIVHIRVMNADLHRTLQQGMAPGLKGNPFAAHGTLMVNASQMQPGAGLYVLMLALAVAAVLTHSKILKHLRLAEATRGPREGVPVR